MWMVFVNGTWQRVESDAVVVVWIGLGLVDADTPVRRGTEEGSTCAAEVELFASALAERDRSSTPATVAVAHAGTRRHRSSGPTKAVWAVLAVFVLVAAVRIRLERARHGHDVDAPSVLAARAPSSLSGTAAASSTAATDVLLARLLADYADNEVRGDDSYRGKLVRVTGVVGEMRRDVLGDAYVTVGTGADFESSVVQCYLSAPSQTNAASLSHGQHVTVHGRVEGLMVNVLLRECEIER